MTSLDFLYIALGGGFVLLVIFLCVMLLHLTLVLRDVTKITANLKSISDRFYELVMDPMKTLSEITAGFGFINNLIEKIRQKIAEASKSNAKKMEHADFEDLADEKEVEDIYNKKKKRSGIFSVNKLGK